ncbi:hypothetical protein ACH3VR_20740 [Microbacterium sp. B2969]|uniref:Uncharacterized protein n=1 Tax=Microbacterium alkaliflavum TaxID=3248839 RepID=A0ABW7QD32_9MICO
MNATATGISPTGLLPEARHRLEATAAALQRLQRDTAWECDAARAYRSGLGRLIDELDAVRRDAQSLEYEVRAAWQQSLAGAW